jgi:hypothetical protein
MLVPRTRSSHEFAEHADADFGFKSGTKRIDLLVSLSIPKFVTSAPQMLTNFGIGTLAAVFEVVAEFSRIARADSRP